MSGRGAMAGTSFRAFSVSGCMISGMTHRFRPALIAACLALAACTHSEITTAFDGVVVAASVGSAFMGANPPGIPPGVALQAQKYFNDVLEAAPAISAELDSMDSAATQTLKISGILAPYAQRDIRGAPPNLVAMVQAVRAAIQAFLSILGRAQAAAVRPGIAPGGGSPVTLSRADRKAIAKTVAKAHAALGRR